MNILDKTEGKALIYLTPYESYEAIERLEIHYSRGLWKWQNQYLSLVEKSTERVLLKLYFAPVISLPDLEKPQWWEYLADFVLPNYFIVLAQAGIAALGLAEEGFLDSHKVIRKYMTRAKQGKSQLKHLKTKGKSRAGSRIRLAQTKLFFEEINEKLQDWDGILELDYIFYSASIELWNGLFDAQNSPPFTKDDERLRVLKYYVNMPDFQNLKEINRYISQNMFYIAPELEEFFF